MGSVGFHAFAAALLAVVLYLAGIPKTFADPEAVEAGRRIALGETEAPKCARCHGERGEGNPAAGHPRLTAQSRFYLLKQLEDFAAGTRPSEDMEPIARKLTSDQRSAAAAYYASVREAPYPPRPEGDPLLLQCGGTLSAVGSPQRGIRACALCHAGAGTGIPPSFPYLAGQYADYTARQLLLWKRGRRHNDPLDVMGEIARKLSDTEIQGLALYFARVRLPSDSINDLTPAEPWPPSAGVASASSGLSPGAPLCSSGSSENR